MMRKHIDLTQSGSRSAIIYNKELATAHTIHHSNMDAIILIDPYNDFLHPDGKLYSRLEESLKKTNTIENLHKLLKIARAKHIPIYYCLHQQTHAHVMEGWTRMNASLTGLKAKMVFEEGS